MARFLWSVTLCADEALASFVFQLWLTPNMGICLTDAASSLDYGSRCSKAHRVQTRNKDRLDLLAPVSKGLSF